MPMSNVVLVDLFTCIVLDAEKRLNLTFGYMRKITMVNALVLSLSPEIHFPGFELSR